MSIEAGVQFLFVKALVYKDFPIPFNENRRRGYILDILWVKFDDELSAWIDAKFNSKQKKV